MQIGIIFANFWIWMLYVGISLVALTAICCVWGYRYAKAHEALVRTGWRGVQVVMDKGIFALPLLHDIKAIPLNTIMVSVECKNAAIAITKDRYHIHAKANFYLKVEPLPDMISKAARLSQEPFQESTLKKLFQDKFIFSVVSILAAYELQQICNQRAELGELVQKKLEPTLREYGLKLESVDICEIQSVMSPQIAQQNIPAQPLLARIFPGALETSSSQNELAFQILEELKIS